MEEVDLAILDHIDKKFSDIFRWLKRKSKMKISSYLMENSICYLNVKTRDEAIYQLACLLKKNNIIDNHQIFYKAVLEREKIVSTGIGMGVAIPHAKLPGLKDFFIALGIQKERGLNWEALDHSPVRLIFMIGGPENKQNEYLHILSHITMLMKDEKLRKQLLQMASSEDIFSLIKTF